MRLHEFIAFARQEILGYAARQLKKRSPNRPEAELIDALPQFVHEVELALRVDDGIETEVPPPRTSGAAIQHGRQRHRAGFDITFAIEGFGCVCDAISGVAAQKKLSFTAREYQILNKAVDDAIATALVEYTELDRTRRHEQETEELGAFAHELRNALSSATMAFEVIQSGQVGVNSRTGEILRRNLVRMETLVGQALARVQLESPLEVEREPLVVEPLLHELAGAAAPERGITVHVEATDDVVLEGDRRLLVSAVSNLLQNALKFTRSQGRVVLRARAADDDAIIEVEDECGGLPPGRENELFAPFVQRSHDRRGLGLGLAITRRAAEAQGGRVEVRNKPGVGCVFSLTLRRAPVGARA